MDIVGFSLTVFRETYNLALFVYEVVQDVREYDNDKDQIRQKLQHEIFFLEAFNKFFLDAESGGIIHDPNLPAAYPLRILTILQNLRDCLGVYSKLALKHYPPYQRLILDGDGVEEHGGADGPSALGGSSKKEKDFDFDKTGFRARVRSLSLRAWDWSLFDKRKLEEVVTQFREWCEKLKEIMQFSMLFAIRFKDPAALKDFQNSETAKKTGLEHVAQRQFLNRCKTIEEASPLKGKLIETPNSVNGSSTKLMRLVTGSEQPYGMPVAVEYKVYSVPPATDDTTRQNLLKVKSNIKTLATVLLNSAFVEGEGRTPITSPFNAPVLNAFQCIGYIDEPENSRMAFVFRLPPQAANLGSLQTLHAFIEEVDPRKKRPVNILSLEQRFAIAHNLCMTVLNLHGSGWVHKSIRSTNVILLPGPPPSLKLIPYVTGFEFSRPVMAATEVGFDFDLDRNLYRHPSRQGYPTATFTKLHDLYALGVVLLEVGTWKTVTGRLRPGFEQAKKFGKVPSPEYVRQTLIKIANDELPPIMRGRYAKAVVKCLEGDFGVVGVDAQVRELGLAFREQVVDVMVDGLKL
jgi:serine/threonine protein kinase